MTTPHVRAALLLSLATIGLAPLTAGAQPATQPAKDGPFKLTLADVNVCLDTLNAVEKTLAEAEGRGQAQTVRNALESARTTAGEPVKGVPIPWAFADNLAAGPYLQNVSSTSVLIRWTAIESEATVRYGMGDKLTSTATAVRLPAPRRMHEALLTGLTGGVEYGYSIRMGGKDVGGKFRAAPPGDAPFAFAVWGDNQRDPRAPEVHAAVAGQMARQPIDLALSVGDIVELGVMEGDYYQDFFRPAADFFRNVPFVAAVGNHDSLGDPDLARYRRWIRHPGGDKTYYAFSYANCRFIVLDSNDPGLFAGPQLEWLKQELASDACRKARFRFLTLHYSPYCWDWFGGDKKVQQTIVPLAEQNQVDMIFGGHFHCYERGVRALKDHKTYYVVTGGGGGMFTEPGRFAPGKNAWEFMAGHEWKHHFVLVNVDAGGLTVRAIDDKGEVFDQFSTGAAPAPSSRPVRAAPPAPQSRPANAPAGGLALKPEETTVCTLSAADRAAALTAISDCRKALAGRNAEAAFRLELIAAVLEEARNAAREGTWSGPFGRTGQMVPLLRVDQSFHYRMRPSESADASVKAMLDNQRNTGTYRITGEDILRGSAFGAGLTGGWRWVLVDSIAPK